MTLSRSLALLAAVLAANILAISIPAAAPATPPVAAAEPAPDPFTQDLLRRLASTNTTERDAAQKQLASIAQLFQQSDVMQQLSDTTPDAELKSLFQLRVNQLKAKEEEKRITSLPPLTLSLKTASLSQVLDALNKSLNAPTKLTAVNNGAPETGSFDLDVKDKPFWEIFALLQDQQPLELSNNGTAGIRVMPIASGGLRRYAIDGPAMAWVTNVTYSRNVNYRNPADTSSSQPSLNITLMIAIDPRVRGTQFKTTKITKAVDDEGRSYRASPGGGYSSGPTNFFNQNLMVVPPERLGKFLNVSFDAALTTTVGDPVTTIDDIQKNLNKPFTMGTRIVRITNFDTNNPNFATYSLSVTAANPGEPTPMDSGNNRTTYSITDATGRTLISSTMSMGGTMSNSFPIQNATPPYKLELRSPGRPLDIPLHLELKDLPLP